MSYVSKIIVKADGKLHETDQKGTFDPGGDVAGEPEAIGGKLYHESTEAPGVLETNYLITKDTDLTLVNSMRGAVVKIEMDTGQRYMLRDASTIGTVKFDASGKSPWRIAGIAEEM